MGGETFPIRITWAVALALTFEQLRTYAPGGPCEREEEFR